MSAVRQLPNFVAAPQTFQAEHAPLTVDGAREFHYGEAVFDERRRGGLRCAGEEAQLRRRGAVEPEEGEEDEDGVPYAVDEFDEEKQGPGNGHTDAH